MAPRKKSVGMPQCLLNNALSRDNNYLRSLSDYQARVRRRESIRNSKNTSEYDLEQKIEFETKIREGSSRLLAAARHPAQSLEAARALFTSSKKVTAYMDELQHRGRDATGGDARRIAESKGVLSISDLRFPLMWKDSDHFKNRGDYRRFAVFCIVRVGADVQDTSLMYPIDREQTDISFPDVLLFNNVPADFELTLEVYSRILQEDLSIASTPRRIRSTIHSSISKTVGKKIAATLRNECEASRAPEFDSVATARMTLDHTDTSIRSHDLALHNLGSKSHSLPLFGHFCCRLVVTRVRYVDKEACAGFAIINDRRCWLRLRSFQVEAWPSKEHSEDSKEPIHTIRVNKETVVRRPSSRRNEIRIVSYVDGNEERDTLEFESNEDTQKWFEQLTICVEEHAKWKHAATSIQRVPCFENFDNFDANATVRDRLDDETKRSRSLYDSTPLVERTLPKTLSGITKSAKPFEFDSEYCDSLSTLALSPKNPSAGLSHIINLRSNLR